MVDKLDYAHKFMYKMQERSTFIRELIHRKRHHDQEMLRKIKSNQYFLSESEQILDIIGRDSLFKKVLRYEGKQSLRYITSKYAKILHFVNRNLSSMPGKDFDRMEDMGIPALKMKVELSHSSQELARKAQELHDLMVLESEHLKEGKIKEYLEDIKREEELENRVIGHFGHFADSLRAFEDKLRRTLTDAKNTAFFPYNTAMKTALFAAVVGTFVMGYMQNPAAIIPGSASLGIEGMRRYLKGSWTPDDEHKLREMVNVII